MKNPIQPPALSISDLNQFDHRAPAAGGSERRFLCPLCGAGHKADAAHRSLTANLSSGAWHCHRCDAKGKLKDFWTEQPASARPISRRDRGRADLRRRSTITLPITPSPADPEREQKWRDMANRSTALDGSIAAEYLTGRCIPVDLAKAARARYCADWYGRPAVLFPIYDLAGKLIAAQGRYVDGKSDPKTRTGGPVGNGVFATAGAWAAPLIVIAEAPIDALTLAAAGYPAIALCGKDVRTWIVQKCVTGNVAIAFDADDAGDQAAEKWTAALKQYGAIVTRLRPPSGAKDWNELAIHGGIASVKRAILPECPYLPLGGPYSAFTPAMSLSSRLDTVSVGQGDGTEVQAAATTAQPAPGKMPQNTKFPNGCNEIARLADHAARAAIASAASDDLLIAAVKELIDACDLPNGYTDPTDPFADDALHSIALELRRMLQQRHKIS